MTVTGLRTSGLRERKKAQTRLALEAAALDLFRRQGFERTTVEQIAEQCDVSPRTFFRYFATKEDVLFGDKQERLDQFLAVLRARPGDEAPLESIRRAALALFEMPGDDPETMKARAHIVMTTPALRSHGFEDQYDWNDAAIQALAGRADAAPRAPLHVRLVVLAGHAAIRAAMESWVEDDRADLAQFLNDAFDELGRGLS